jgi:ATP-dependent Clp protease ATP-binding subunit ClpB
MEIDSKPEVMDKLDRRLIQLKIEREAVKKEKDEASQKRLVLIEDEIEKLEREYADLDEIWRPRRRRCRARPTSRKRSTRFATDGRAAAQGPASTSWPNCNTANCRSSKRSS